MIAIVTDSTVYLTKDQAAQLGVRVAPMRYTVNSQPFIESYSDGNGEFLPFLSGKYSVSTGQVPVAAFASAFAELLRRGYQVLCLTISSRLSGCYRSAFLAAQQLPQGKDKILVVDSLTTAGGLSLLCQEAVRLNDGSRTLEQLALAVEEIRGRIGLRFSLDSMDALRRSGRIGIVRQSVSTMLSSKPILMCRDGSVVSCGTQKGRSGQVKGLLEQVPAQVERFVVITMGRAQEMEQPLVREIGRRWPGVPIQHSTLGPVLGVHLGSSVTGVAWLEKENS